MQGGGESRREGPCSGGAPDFKGEQQKHRRQPAEGVRVPGCTAVSPGGPRLGAGRWLHGAAALQLGLIQSLSRSAERKGGAAQAGVTARPLRIRGRGGVAHAPPAALWASIAAESCMKV